MSDRVQAPGGSVANTLAGLGNLGLTTAFIGRVHDDALGRFYARTHGREGTDFVNPPVAGGDLPTSRSMIFVRPDGERSMNTYLGISSELGPEDVSDERGGRSGHPVPRGLSLRQAEGQSRRSSAPRSSATRAAGKAGIALSDPFCVDRHRDDFRRLVKELDYVIGNEHEWTSLYQTDLEAALEQAAADAGLVVCTRSGHDVIIVRGEEQAVVPVRRVVPVDATGAGDQFAAGFLYGLATGQSLATCGRMGCVAAAEVISHFGARPEADLKALFRKEGLI